MADNDFFDYDSEITTDSQGFILLPEGDYIFQVQKVERMTYTGASEKIGYGCPMIKLGLVIQSPQGNTSVEDTLFLKKSMEWKLSAFFRSIGQKQHGQTFKMDWNIMGKEGRCHLVQESWEGRDGQTKTSNRIGQYLDGSAPKKADSAATAPEQDMPFEI